MTSFGDINDEVLNGATKQASGSGSFMTINSC